MWVTIVGSRRRPRKKRGFALQGRVCSSAFHIHPGGAGVIGTIMAHKGLHVPKGLGKKAHGGAADDRRKLGMAAEEIEEVTEAFQLFDTDQKGSIDVKELKAAFRALGFQATNSLTCRPCNVFPLIMRPQVKKQEIRQMLVDIDKLEASSVLFEEFVEMVTPRMTGRDAREEIMKVHINFIL